MKDEMLLAYDLESRVLKLVLDVLWAMELSSLTKKVMDWEGTLKESYNKVNIILLTSGVIVESLL